MEIKYLKKPHSELTLYRTIDLTRIFGQQPFHKDVRIFMKASDGKSICMKTGKIFEESEIAPYVFLYDVEFPNTAEIDHKVHINDLQPGDVFDYYALYHEHKRAMMCENNQFIDLDKAELTPLEELKTLQETVYKLKYAILIKGPYSRSPFGF